jgi:hypothetical protein
MATKTRKAKTKSKSGIKSIPELRRAFEHIEPFAHKLAAQVHTKKLTKGAASEAYAKEWKKVFGRPMKSKSAQASIEHYMSLGKQRGGEAELLNSASNVPTTSATPLQRGGAAPVNWSDTQPGIYSAPTLPGQVDAAGYTAYGSFLPYVEKGFSVGIPADGLAATCDGKNSWPMPAANIGTNQVPPKGDIPTGATTYIKPQAGGKRAKRTRKQKGGAAMLAAAFRPFEATNPTSATHDAMMSIKGQGLPASPDPSDPAWSYRTANVQAPVIGAISAINRNLVADVNAPK